MRTKLTTSMTGFLLAICAAATIAATPAAPADQKVFTLTSSAIASDGKLPREFTGDGESASPPLQWTGAPAGTTSFALVMHHLDPEGKTKWYWIEYNIPASVTSLARSEKNVGTFGNNSVNNKTEYAPPHSKGPGAKTYVLTLYALSAAPQITVAPEKVDRDTLLAAIKDRTLASAELKVTYDRTDVIGNAPDQDNGGPQAGNGPPPPEGGPHRGLHLLPREIVEQLKLTDDQRDQLQKLEEETNEKLGKVLTAEQMQTVNDFRPPQRDGQGPPPPN